MKCITIVAMAAIAASAAFGIDHRGFGRIADERAQSIVYAPSALVVDGVYTGEALLTTNDYWHAGWRSICDVPPQTDSNHYAVATGWANREEHWIDRQYEIRVVPPPPARRIYKYDLSVAAMEYGEITNLITYISADIGVKWMWDAAEILVESDPFFISATNEVVQSGVIDEAKVKAILNRAYELGQSAEVSK